MDFNLPNSSVNYTQFGYKKSTKVYKRRELIKFLMNKVLLKVSSNLS